jgi:hypothetical protein
MIYGEEAHRKKEISGNLISFYRPERDNRNRMHPMVQTGLHNDNEIKINQRDTFKTA